MRTHPLRHNHAGRGSHRTRCLALGLCLTAGLALSACGPAHKGQLTVEPVSASAEASSTKGSSTKPSPSKSSTPTPSATPSASWTMPSVTITNERTDIWQQKDDLLSLPMETSFLITGDTSSMIRPARAFSATSPPRTRTTAETRRVITPPPPPRCRNNPRTIPPTQ